MKPVYLRLKDLGNNQMISSDEEFLLTFNI